MESFLLAFLAGYASAALLRVLVKGIAENRSLVGWLCFLASLLLAFILKIKYSSDVAIIIAGIGMQLGAIWPPGKRQFPLVDLRYIFIGILLVINHFLLLPVITVLLLKKQLGRKYLYILCTVIVATMLAIYYLQEPDIIVFYLLVLFIATTLQNNSVQPLLSVKFKKLGYIAILTIIFLFLYLNRYVYHGFGMQLDIFRSGPQTIEVVALTFDDGPNPKYTEAILDILKEKEVPATFFMVGKHVKKYPEIAKRVVEEGHLIGNHTYSHTNLLGSSKQKVINEILNNQKIIEEVTGITPKYFRPPRGMYNKTALETAADNNLTMVLWSVSSQDWASEGWKDIVRNVTKRVKPGAVILFHDSGDFITAQGGGRDNTIKALPMIIDDLQKKGYTFVSLPQMLALSGLIGEEDFGEYPGEILHE